MDYDIYDDEYDDDFYDDDICFNLVDTKKCETKKEFEKISFTWIIENFSSCQEELSVTLTTSTLDRGSKNKSQWKLLMNPKGSNEDTEDFLSLFLCLEKSDKLPLLTKFGFYILAADETRKYIQKINSFYFLRNSSKHGFNKYVRRDLLFNSVDELLPNDKLTVGCDISMECDSMTIISCSATTKLQNYSMNVMENVGKLLKSPHLSDCIIKVGKVNIDVHKVILACRSEFFLSMFNNNGEEFESNIINIKDFRLEVVKEMITYIYTGNSPNLNDMTSELLMIATKYNLKELKNMAESNLGNKLNVINVCDYLKMSETYAAKLLKKCCMKFICKNAIGVIKSEKWKNIVFECPLLLDEIFKCSIGVD